MKIFMYEDVNSSVLFIVPADSESEAINSLKKFRPNDDSSYHYHGESSEFSENDEKGPIAVITDNFRIRLPGNDLYLEKIKSHFPQSHRVL